MIWIRDWVTVLAFIVVAVAITGVAVMSFRATDRNAEWRNKCTEKGGIVARKWADGNLAFRCIKSFDVLE